jgi:hypothetical protein
MKTTIKTLLVLLPILTFRYSMSQAPQENIYSIITEVDNFRHVRGSAQFALSNQDGTIHDEN